MICGHREACHARVLGIPNKNHWLHRVLDPKNPHSIPNWIPDWCPLRRGEKY